MGKTHATRQSNFYPRPPRGGRPFNEMEKKLTTPISIHALREEGDLDTMHLPGKPFNFYPRPPRGGRHSKKSLSLPS